MNSWFLLAVVLIPFLGGFGLLVHPARTRRGRDTYVFWLCLANSLLVGALLIFRPASVTLLSFGGQISLTLHLDGLSFVFAAILAILWPITNLYAFEYMSHLEGENRFFAFFTMTYGVVLGIAFAANTFTLYPVSYTHLDVYKRQLLLPAGVRHHPEPFPGRGGAQTALF